MFGREKTETLVVGAGPVGMLAALILARRGVRVQIVDAQWRVASRSYGLVLHPRSLALLADVGLADAVIQAGHQVDRVVFYSGQERRLEVPISELQVEYPFLVVLSQRILEELLERALRREGVKVLWNHRVVDLEPSSERSTVRVEKLGKETTGYSVATTVWVVDGSFASYPAFVVGADGHGSVVRRALGFDYDDAGPAELFGVFECRGTSLGDAREARVVLGDGTSSVLWPMGNQRCRWSFRLDDWVDYPEPRVKSRLLVALGPSAFPYLSADRLGELVAERAPWFQVDGVDVVWSAAVQFERRLASGFGRQNVWLAGDAAHLAGPLGVHSMNVGLREAHDLATRIEEVLHAGKELESLERYDRERSREWGRLLKGEGLAAQSGTDPWVRQEAARILSALPASGSDLEYLLAMVGLEWRELVVDEVERA